jgi:hypothetical protein
MSTNEGRGPEPFRLEPQFPDEEQANWSEAEESQRSEQAILVIEIPLAQEEVVIAGHMGRIIRKLTAEMDRQEAAGKAIAQVVNSIIPTDQASYTELCERLEDNNQFLKGAEMFVEPWKKLFYRPYQAILERAKQIVGAPTQSLANGKNRRLAFERDVKAKAEAETMRLRKEQQDREEAQRLENAVKAEEMGLSPAAVETILEQPSTAPAPVAAPQIFRPQGVRKLPPNWQAELTDKAAFWAWAKKQREMPVMLLIDMPAMNREAKTHKATLAQRFPGWRGVNKGGD